MSTLSRLFLGILVTLALASAHGVAATASPTHGENAADNIAVSYKRVVKECSTYVMDGQEQKQCKAAFTVSVTGIKKGYKVVVTAKDPQYDMTTTIGKFTSDGSSASKRFRDVVTSYGDPDDQIKMRFRAIVKNAAGEKVFASRPHTF